MTSTIITVITYIIALIFGPFIILIIEVLKAIIDVFLFIIEMLWFMGQTCYPKFNKLTNKKFRKCFQKIQYNK